MTGAATNTAQYKDERGHSPENATQLLYREKAPNQNTVQEQKKRNAVNKRRAPRWAANRQLQLRITKRVVLEESSLYTN